MPKENFELEVFRKKVMDELASIKDRARSIEADADELAWVIAELEEELVEFFEPAEDALDDERTDPEEEKE